MKNLIALNFAVGFLLAACCVAGEIEFFCWLPLTVLGPVFFGLVFLNLAAVIKLWKQKRFGAFLPISTYLAAVVMFLVVYDLGSTFVLKNTPCRPNTFFTEQTKSELTKVANQLLLEVRENKRHELEIPPVLASKLNQYSLRAIDVDRQRQIVVVGYYHHDYHSYQYIYSRSGSNGLTELPANTQVFAQQKLDSNWYFRIR